MERRAQVCGHARGANGADMLPKESWMHKTEIELEKASIQRVRNPRKLGMYSKATTSMLFDKAKQTPFKRRTLPPAVFSSDE